MAYDLTKYWWIVYINMSLGILISLQYLVDGKPQVPCFFIFGDSLVDNGNNNNLFTLAKSNFPPYGIDFPNGRVTGRFSNGRNMADFTAELLGFEDYIPPFADSSGANILLGINYASSGAGILNETGQSFGQHISLDNQLQNHLITISRILNITRSNESTVKHLNNCFYYVGMGSNDYLNNFEPELFATVPGKFANELVQQYSRQIKTLYDNGARKIGLYGIAAAGCTPYEIGKFGTNGHLCVEQLNSEVQIFNTKLKSLVDELNDNHKNAKFIYVNIYDLTLEVVANPSSFGFRVINEACCGLGENKRLPCVPLETPCENRSEYLFWDAFHPSEVSHKIMADRSYRAQREGDTYPMDIFSLAHLQLED